MIRARIVRELGVQAARREVVDVRIGLGYTAVVLDDGHAGLAYTFSRSGAAGCSPFRGPRPLAGRSAADLLALLAGDGRLERTVGLATANALANRAHSGMKRADVLELLDVADGEPVGMVGYFGPLVGPLRTRGARLTVFEEDAERGPGLEPASRAVELLPRCSVAISGPVDELAAAAAGCREVVLVGASTPLLPSAFDATSVTLLAGVVVTDPGGALRVVSEAGGMRFFGPYIEKVALAAS